MGRNWTDKHALGYKGTDAEAIKRTLQDLSNFLKAPFFDSIRLAGGTRTYNSATGQFEQVADLAGVIYGTYTPQIDQGASSNIAKTIETAMHVTQWGLVTVWTTLAVTAAGTAGSAITVTVPFTRHGDHDALDTVGDGMIYDASTTTRYKCGLEWASTTAVRFYSDASGNSFIGATPSFALASGDAIRFKAEYRIV